MNFPQPYHVINRIRLSLLFLCVCLTGREALGQNLPSAFGSSVVRVVKEAVIIEPLVIALGITSRMPGTTVAIDPYGNNSWRFTAKGPASASFTISFPLQATLQKITSGSVGVAKKDQVSFTRGVVIVSAGVASRGAAKPFLQPGVAAGSAIFPGVPGQDEGAALCFWVGGFLKIPLSVSPGYYQGNYLITISDIAI